MLTTVTVSLLEALLQADAVNGRSSQPDPPSSHSHGVTRQPRLPDSGLDPFILLHGPVALSKSLMSVDAT